MYKYNDTRLNDFVVMNKLYFDLAEMDVSKAYASLYNRFHKSWGWDSLPPDSKLENNIRIGKISAVCNQDDVYRGILKHYFTMLELTNNIKIYKWIKDAIVCDKVNAKKYSDNVLDIIPKTEFKVMIFLELNSHIALLNDNTLEIKGSVMDKEFIYPFGLYVDVLGYLYNNKYIFQDMSYIMKTNTMTNIRTTIQSAIDTIIYTENLSAQKIIHYFGIPIPGESKKLYFFENNMEIQVNDSDIDPFILKRINRKKYFSKDSLFFLKLIIENISTI